MWDLWDLRPRSYGWSRLYRRSCLWRWSTIKYHWVWKIPSWFDGLKETVLKLPSLGLSDQLPFNKSLCEVPLIANSRNRCVAFTPFDLWSWLSDLSSLCQWTMWTRHIVYLSGCISGKLVVVLRITLWKGICNTFWQTASFNRILGSSPLECLFQMTMHYIERSSNPFLVQKRYLTDVR